MSEHTYKVIELIGTSQTSIDQAVKNALDRAAQTIRHARWFEVARIRLQAPELPAVRL